MESKGDVLAKLYREDFNLLSDSDLIEKFDDYVFIVFHIAHSFRDEVALDVLATLLIERKLRTSKEIKDYFEENEK